MKCWNCGEQATLQLRDTPNLVSGEFIVVKNALLYHCDECGEGVVPDVMEIDSRAQHAYRLGLKEIEFVDEG
jgi:YgiT-type zinc finger domain-containing protein